MLLTRTVRKYICPSTGNMAYSRGAMLLLLDTDEKKKKMEY